jgi:phosphate-selective porin OprO and OprP
MRRKFFFTLFATSLLTWPSLALAEEMTATDLAAMRAEIAALRMQVESLESRLDTASLAQPNAPAASSLLNPVVASAENSQTKFGWNGAPEVETSDGWSFKPRGRILFDTAYVGSPKGLNDAGLGFSNEVRRARLGVSGTIPGGFGYRLEGDFAAGGVDLTDVFLTYEDGRAKLTIGQHNGFQGLEELSSSNDTSFIERAAFTDAFGFVRRLGVSGEYDTGDLLIQGGVFTDNFAELSSDENKAVGVDGRVVFAPKLGSSQLHLGASVHWRDLGNTQDMVRYRQRPLVHTTDTRFISTPLIDAEQEKGYGVETAFIHGRLHGMAEAYWQKLDRKSAVDPTFFGGSIEAGFFLTDDTRGYKSGVFKGVKVKRPVGDGGIGAVQFNLRYDYLDLNDAGIIGGTQNAYMASLIWTPIDYVRFMINYARLNYHDAVIPAGTNRNYGVDTVGARAQIAF